MPWAPESFRAPRGVVLLSSAHPDVAILPPPVTFTSTAAAADEGTASQTRVIAPLITSAGVAAATALPDGALFDVPILRPVGKGKGASRTEAVKSKAVVSASKAAVPVPAWEAVRERDRLAVEMIMERCNSAPPPAAPVSLSIQRQLGKYNTGFKQTLGYQCK